MKVQDGGDQETASRKNRERKKSNNYQPNMTNEQNDLKASTHSTAETTIRNHYSQELVVTWAVWTGWCLTTGRDQNKDSVEWIETNFFKLYLEVCFSRLDKSFRMLILNSEESLCGRRHLTVCSTRTEQSFLHFTHPCYTGKANWGMMSFQRRILFPNTHKWLIIGKPLNILSGSEKQKKTHKTVIKNLTAG